jgi:hypothetical protein
VILANNKKMFEKGNISFGPFPADGFGSAQYENTTLL